MNKSVWDIVSGESLLAEIMNDERSFGGNRLIEFALKADQAILDRALPALTPPALFVLYLHAVALFGTDIPENIDAIAARLQQVTGFQFPKSPFLRSTLNSPAIVTRAANLLNTYNFRVPLSLAATLAPELRTLAGRAA